MGKSTEARRRIAEGDQADWLALYAPRAVDPEVWKVIRPFVVEAAGRLRLRDSASGSRVVRVVARFAAWCVGQGLPLDVELVFDPDTVERYVALGLRNGRSRATYRAVLRRVAPELTRRAPWEPRPAPVARRKVAVPYSPAEVEILQRDAGAQPTPRRKRAARALLALGAGTGLDGRWIARVTAGDVRRCGGVVRVKVGEPAPRQVPVLASWEDEVLELAASGGEEFLVGGRSTSRNRAGALAASLVTPLGHPRLSASRLRSTWLVHHLTIGTRLPELATAAGMAGVTVLSDLLLFVPTAAPEDADRMLRGVLR